MSWNCFRVDLHLLVIAPQKFRIETVRDRLAVVAEKQVEAFFVRITC